MLSVSGLIEQRLHIVRGGITRDDARLRGRRRNLASTSQAEVSGRRYPTQIQLINTPVYVALFFAESGLASLCSILLGLDLSAKYPLITPVVRSKKKSRVSMRKNKSRLNWKIDKVQVEYLEKRNFSKDPRFFVLNLKKKFKNWRDEILKKFVDKIWKK